MSNIKKIKNYEIGLIFMGSLMIGGGITAQNIMPWIDEITLIKIESCIADMHFRHNNETQFQECVITDLKKVETIQTINALTTILYSMGGVFIGLGFRKKSESKKPVNKQDICNCGTAFRCPTHNK